MKTGWLLTRSVPLAAILFAAITGSSAQASELRFVREEDDRAGFTALVLSYRADPAEINDVTVTPLATGYIRFTDPGASIRFEPVTGCRQIDDHQVECLRKGYNELRVRTFDGADRVHVEKGDRPVAFVAAGAGDDVIALAGRDDVKLLNDSGFGEEGRDRVLLARGSDGYGGEGADVIRAGGRSSYLDGGPGDDRLRGGSAGDDLNGGGGSDVLQGMQGDDFFQGDDEGNCAPTISADRMEGGLGLDSVDYGCRQLRVVVKLNDGKPDGSRGERDVLSSVENASGGTGDDLIVGDSGPNRLRGYDGSDLLLGGGGDDDLGGDDGRDRLFGGPGADVLQTGDIRFGEGPEDVACGRGEDVVVKSEVDRLVPDCELVKVGPCLVRSIPSGSAVTRRLRFSASCKRRTSLQITLGSRNAPLGKGERTVKGKAGTVSVKLTPAGARALRRRRMVRVEIATSRYVRIGYAIPFPGF